VPPFVCDHPAYARRDTRSETGAAGFVCEQCCHVEWGAAPKVGDGATMHIGADRLGATVIEVGDAGRTLFVQLDRALPLCRAGRGDAVYLHERNADGITVPATLRTVRDHQRHPTRFYKGISWETRSPGGIVTVGLRRTWRTPIH